MSSTALNDAQVGPRSFEARRWVQQIFGRVAFVDRRLFDRVVRIFEAGSRLFEGAARGGERAARAARRGAQRLFENVRVRSSGLRAKGVAFMMDLVRGAGSVVAMHDSSEIDLTGRHEPDDAGPLRSSNARGYLVHAVVLVDAEHHMPRGILTAQAWERSWELKHNDQRRPAHQKESIKWRRGLSAALQAAPEDARRWIHVMDREGDVHENFEFATEQNLKVVVGVRGDHRIAEGSGALRRYLKHQRIAGTREVEMTSSATGKRETRKLAVSFASITLLPRKNVPAHRNRKPVALTAVWVRGDSPTQQWMLFTTCAVDNETEAWAVFNAYRARTVGEDAFKMLKTGLAIEGGSIRDIASFRRKLAILVPLATHLLQLNWLARHTPNDRADAYLDPTTLKLLRLAAKFHCFPTPSRRWTVRDAIACIAQLGGYQPRPGGPPPGWLTIWRGWNRFSVFRETTEFVRTLQDDSAI